MPWINEELCTGCQSCIDECVACAIAMRDGVAFIDEAACIRCGICHGVCPNDAVCHDSERIPQEVEANLHWVNELLSHPYYAGDEEARQGLVRRMVRYYVKNQRVAEQTIKRLQAMAEHGLADGAV